MFQEQSDKRAMVAATEADSSRTTCVERIPGIAHISSVQWGVVLSSRADEFRKNADECVQQAARSKHADDKERWLRVAQHFVQMAQQAETEQPQQS